MSCLNRLLGMKTATALTGMTLSVLPAIALANEEVPHEGGPVEHGFDTTALLASGVNFALLVTLFVWLFSASVKKALVARRAEIEQQLNEAARLKAEASAKHREYSERMARLDDELAQIRKDMISAGEKERDRIVAEAEHKAARMRKEAQFLIEQHAKQLRADLTREAVEGAILAAEQLLLRSTTSYDQQRLAQEYLSSLDQTARLSGAPGQTPQPESHL